MDYWVYGKKTKVKSQPFFLQNKKYNFCPKNNEKNQNKPFLKRLVNEQVKNLGLI